MSYNLNFIPDMVAVGQGNTTQRRLPECSAPQKPPKQKFKKLHFFRYYDIKGFEFFFLFSRNQPLNSADE
jgi:hypothetical protein